MPSLGGFQDLKVDDSEVKAIAERVVKKLNQESNDPHYRSLVNVVSAKSQIVAGVNYKMELVVGKLNALKNEIPHDQFDPSKHSETSENDRETHTVTVWSKPWENFEQITFESKE